MERKPPEVVLVWILIWMSFIYQASFGFVMNYAMLQSSFLYLALFRFGITVPQVWGVLGVLALIILVGGIAYKSRIVIRLSSVAQLMLWVFAVTAYFMTGQYFLALGIGLTQLAFWSWVFLRLDRTRKPVLDSDSKVR